MRTALRRSLTDRNKIEPFISAASISIISLPEIERCILSPNGTFRSSRDRWTKAEFSLCARPRELPPCTRELTRESFRPLNVARARARVDKL